MGTILFRAGPWWGARPGSHPGAQRLVQRGRPCPGGAFTGGFPPKSELQLPFVSLSPARVFLKSRKKCENKETRK